MTTAKKKVKKAYKPAQYDSAPMTFTCGLCGQPDMPKIKHDKKDCALYHLKRFLEIAQEVKLQVKLRV